jgi:ribose transport system ATP-binding protein
VLRDGATRGTFAVDAVSEDEILNLIVGRELAAAFPPKAAAGGAPVLEVTGLSGERFDDVGLTVREGEILGLAGMEGNGQRDVLRALAGLEAHTGEVRVGGRSVALATVARAQSAGIHYVPSDRQREGLLGDLSVRENTAASSLERFARLGVMQRDAERGSVTSELDAVAVKAPSLEASTRALSGGNQQKVVLARSFLGDPAVLLCDEPTQGVDAGARIEIYRLLRALAGSGRAVIVLSSDALELTGLCDRVAVFSRGQVVDLLAGDEVNEQRITGTALRATGARRGAADSGPRAAPWRRAVRGDQAPGAMLLVAIAALGLYTAGANGTYLTTINVQAVLFLATALALVSLGQLTVLLTGGIDLSVGSMMALTVVILSFFAQDGRGTGSIVLGIAVALGAGIVTGLVNGVLVRRARISPLITTIAMLVVLQGVAMLLRPTPDGVIQQGYAQTLGYSIGPVPIAFLLAIAVAVGCELLLRRSVLGLRLRAVGTAEASAHRLGVKVTPTVVLAYVICSLFAVLGGIVLAAQVGVGNAAVGSTYALSSITAVVLGGASIYGGRGSYVAALLGAVLVTQVINALTFLALDQAWQYWFPGALILVAGGVFARARGVRVAALGTAE